MINQWIDMCQLKHDDFPIKRLRHPFITRRYQKAMKRNSIRDAAMTIPRMFANNGGSWSPNITVGCTNCSRLVDRFLGL
jgi:hypothetical protein